MATINSTLSNTLLSGTSGNDTIDNGGYWNGSWHEGGRNVTINAGAGIDYVQNDEGSKVTINTGASNDEIWNRVDASSTSINAGDGADYIFNAGKNISIDAGKGNDEIFNNCYRQDDGSIYYYPDSYGYSSNVLFQYSAGDGNDSIYGFKANSTLSISGGSYSTTKSGSDIIVTVGDGKISLVGAASLSAVNIKFKKTSSTNSKSITLTEGNDSYSNTVSGATINALGGNDTIYNYGESVTVDGGVGNDSIFNNAVNASIVGGNGNDTIWNGNDVLVGGYYTTIDGGKGNDYIYSRSNYVSINGGAGNDTITANELNVTITGGIGNDLISLRSDRKENKLINYTAGDGNDIVYGFNNTTTLNISGGSYSTTKSGKNIIVTVGEGKISLIGAATLSAVNIKGMKTVTEKNSWTLSGTTATYGTSSKTLVTVKGVKSLDGISLKNKVVTIAASALNKSKVTISGGYKLKLADDVSTTATTSNAWSFKNSVATLSQTKGAYYSLASDGKSISYSAGTSKTLTKVSGVKSTDGLSVSGKVVTVAASALNKSKVTISGGYKLALGSDVSTTATTSNAWSYKNSVATLKRTRGEKYSLAGNKKSITYTAATSKNLAKMSGVKSADGLKVSGKVITVPNSIIATSKKVSVNGSGNYEFKFAAQKTLITGSKNADIITSTGANSTINAGKGNDSINISGANNVIVYKNGDGRDTISNYSEDDTIKITSGTATPTVSGSGYSLLCRQRLNSFKRRGGENCQLRCGRRQENLHRDFCRTLHRQGRGGYPRKLLRGRKFRRCKC